MDRKTALLIVVAALGYFVDIYDLVLFNVVKRESLLYLFPDAAPHFVTQKGIFLFNMQMTGMLVGGILWGILGDKRGRVQVLFGSILLYSLANILNAFVSSIPAYAAIRVMAGIGLAGELGAGVTLIAETMHKEKRGIGTMLVVSFGALGAVFAGLISVQGEALGAVLESWFHYPFPNWRVAYIVGGSMGLVLLIMRIGVFESGMYAGIRHAKQVERGNFLLLFRTRKTFLKYLSCILVGVPIWYTIGLLVANSEEIFAPELGVVGKVINGKVMMYCYIGLSVGDLISGILSQVMRSRKKIIYLYLGFTLLLTLWFLYFSHGVSAPVYYFLCFLIGVASGYWVLFVTVASESFGTNIRSTVTNTVPNFVRGSVPLIVSSFLVLRPGLGNIHSAMLVGVVVLALSFVSIYTLPESFAKDLDYVE